MSNATGYYEKLAYVRLARRDIKRIHITLARLEKQLDLLDTRSRTAKRKEKKDARKK